MKFDAAHLLKRLEPSVRPVAGRDGAVAAQFEHQGFGELLALVSSGRVGSGEPVTCDCELHPPLDDAQYARLSAAMDRATVAGSKRSIMLIDGRGLVADIQDRKIDSELTDADHVDTGIDAAVFVASDDEEAGTFPLPATGLIPRGVAEQFEAKVATRRM